MTLDEIAVRKALTAYNITREAHFGRLSNNQTDDAMNDIIEDIGLEVLLVGYAWITESFINYIMDAEKISREEVIDVTIRLASGERPE